MQSCPYSVCQFAQFARRHVVGSWLHVRTRRGRATRALGWNPCGSPAGSGPRGGVPREGEAPARKCSAVKGVCSQAAWTAQRQQRLHAQQPGRAGGAPPCLPPAPPPPNEKKKYTKNIPKHMPNNYQKHIPKIYQTNTKHIQKVYPNISIIYPRYTR